jgi:sporulation protein YlmC with PRC-barrel domain
VTFNIEALGLAMKDAIMDEPLFTIGARATCRDGECGEVIRVVIDPVARKVTHLVIEPTHRQGLGRLVPLDLIESSNNEVTLSCTVQEFEGLEIAEETNYLPGNIAYQGYNPANVLPLPYYALNTSGATLPVTYDKLPLGEVAVRRNDSVKTTDGEIGRVQGIVIDPRDHHVTHVLLQEGHLWGREEVAIPISAVIDFESEIRLNITKQNVKDLPRLTLLTATNSPPVQSSESQRSCAYTLFATRPCAVEEFHRPRRFRRPWPSSLSISPECSDSAKRSHARCTM